MFGIILISAGTLIHIYVFWRAASVPVVDRKLPRKLIVGVGVTLWAIFSSPAYAVTVARDHWPRPLNSLG